MGSSIPARCEDSLPVFDSQETSCEEVVLPPRWKVAPNMKTHTAAHADEQDGRGVRSPVSFSVEVTRGRRDNSDVREEPIVAGGSNGCGDAKNGSVAVAVGVSVRPDVEEGEPLEAYAVEDILDYHWEPESMQSWYLIKWAGWDRHTWEPADNVGESCWPLMERARIRRMRSQSSPDLLADDIAARARCDTA
ncbi:unnamed protein product [Vitrella brassicaformis CCMP3155]|uniref:Chromo domain-containing protein n=1 Tax=Vitrella brassicaformis (strain CCMP3155) TaxID=1169540 RepID=A0A0G4FKT9_VITBC|nr:unnamed protein product [Vitrella brassicaformis CCMP3155]|eukprot:CEM14569.1 unnamed protein product [Vitrella brassicaformis CCMP3155]